MMDFEVLVASQPYVSKSPLFLLIRSEVMALVERL